MFRLATVAMASSLRAVVAGQARYSAVCRPRLAARGWTSRGRLPPRLFTRKRKAPRLRERMEAGTSSTSTVNSSENQVSAGTHVSSGDT